MRHTTWRDREDIPPGGEPMLAGQTEQPTPRDVSKTYNFLRLGIIGTVLLLAVSIGIERSKVDCLQTSLSAYYYTPVRAIFVGTWIAICLALIVYKGRSTGEDFFLNIAGVFAAVVAIAPTTDVGKCWSLPPRPGDPPVQEDGSLADWVVANIENNIYALLAIVFVAMVIMIITAIGNARERRFGEDGPDQRQVTEHDKTEGQGSLLGMWVAVGFSILLFFAGWWAIAFWDDFNTRAHGFAALIAISCLGLAIIFEAYHLQKRGLHLQSPDGKTWKSHRRRYWVYLAIVALMAVGGAVIWWTGVADEHTLFWVEVWEITLFLAYWIYETWVKWKEPVKAVEAESDNAAISPGADRP
jgi:hypothetical protein